jgi:hypothetical protein
MPRIFVIFHLMRGSPFEEALSTTSWRSPVFMCLPSCSSSIEELHKHHALWARGYVVKLHLMRDSPFWEALSTISRRSLVFMCLLLYRGTGYMYM